MPRERAQEDYREETETLRIQRDANEKLVLSALRAQDQADDAVGAQTRAEQAADALRAREQELLTTAEFRERLIGIVGHDLRDPLNTIAMACGLLMAHGRLNNEDGRLVGRIVNTSQRMARMIAQLVEFTRARLGGGFELRLAAGNLGEICRDIADELQVGSTIELDQTSIGDLAGVWDADRLMEALLNIASNAVEHAERGTPVSICARDQGDHVLVEIRNSGACIPPNVLPFIFEPFHGGEKHATSKSGHLGLGLYIACEIARAHAGSLRVSSCDGMTAFTMRLPRVTEQVVAVAPA